VDDAFDIAFSALATRLFREFRERTGPRYENVNHLATHSSRDSAEGAQGDAILGFALFELLDSLSRGPHHFADLPLT
jgi:hypothetical protein